MARESQIHFYGAIEKFSAADDGSLMVSGIASTEAVDADGEIVTADAMRKALPSYLQSGTVREMHQPIAAGQPISAHVDDEGKTHFTAKIIDVGTIAKIKSGVLKGFSIGGKALKKAGNKITELLLKDISVVDLPNNPESFFTVIKFDKPSEKKHDADCDCSDCKKSKMEKTMSDELIQKVDSLATAVATQATSITALLTTVEKLSKQTPVAPDLTKFETALGDLQKRAKDATDAALAQERGTIISKMRADGRVAMKDDGTAYKSDELEKMELPMLKFAARNSMILPTIAKATYTATGDVPDEKTFTKVVDGKTVPMKGSELIQKAWEHLDLNKMIAAGTTAGMN